MHIGEALRFSYESLASNRIRTLLTALGLVIGNASVILVVTISLTSRDYILDLIRGLGSNMVQASFDTSAMTGSVSDADFLKLSDVAAIREALGPRISAATGVMTSAGRLTIGGREEDIRIIGSDEHYRAVRNLVVTAGRFMDHTDVAMRSKVVMMAEKLARQMYGSQEAAVGQTLKLHGLQFDVVGTFKERTSSFGLSELSDRTVLIPITVQQYFAPVERINPLYVQAREAADVVPLTAAVRQIIESRHRSGARYVVTNLTGILEAAQRIATVLTFVLLMIAAIALLISGIGIMNIMLVTVTERTREIGVRMAIGASRREVLQQFLFEAVLISVGGGLIGIVAGLAVPISVRYFAEDVRVPISWSSVAVAFGVSLAVGLIFGILPANRAARMNPTQALRYE